MTAPLEGLVRMGAGVRTGQVRDFDGLVGVADSGFPVLAIVHTAAAGEPVRQFGEAGKGPHHDRETVQVEDSANVAPDHASGPHGLSVLLGPSRSTHGVARRGWHVGGAPGFNCLRWQ